MIEIKVDVARIKAKTEGEVTSPTSYGVS